MTSAERAVVTAPALVMLVAVGALAGCSRSGAVAQDAGMASTDASPPATRDAAAATVPTAHARSTLPPCRVLAVSGKGVVVARSKKTPERTPSCWETRLTRGLTSTPPRA